MKMGEIRVRPDGGFAMMTPDGFRDVTLRCTASGSVEVEEVANQRGLSVEALTIAMRPSPVDEPIASTCAAAEVHRQQIKGDSR